MESRNTSKKEVHQQELSRSISVVGVSVDIQNVEFGLRVQGLRISCCLFEVNRASYPARVTGQKLGIPGKNKLPGNWKFSVIGQPGRNS